MKIINTKSGAAPQAPYSQGIVSNGFLFTAGQVAILPETGKSAGDTVTIQVEQVCKNIQAILEAAGTSMDKVVKTTCFLADISTFDEFNAVYAKYFPQRPARSCFAVKELPLGYLCEVEVIAEL